MRKAKVERKTKETHIKADLNLDGKGEVLIETELPFLNHMLELLARHANFDLTLNAKGDLEVDAHHTVEDIGIVLGQALKQALGKKEGINRYGFCLLPMDEALAQVALDISGRPFLIFDVNFNQDKIGQFETDLFRDFFQAFVNHSGLTLHVKTLYGRNDHHLIESVFKGLAKALQMAVSLNRKNLPSTKEVID